MISLESKKPIGDDDEKKTAFGCLSRVVCMLGSFPLAEGQRRTRSTRSGYNRNAADAAGVYNVRAFGAKGDGKMLDTHAINKAKRAIVGYAARTR